MENDVAFTDQTVHNGFVENVFDCERIVFVGCKVLDIFHSSGGQIIDNSHLITEIKKFFAQMRTDKSSSTGD